MRFCRIICTIFFTDLRISDHQFITHCTTTTSIHFIGVGMPMVVLKKRFHVSQVIVDVFCNRCREWMSMMDASSSAMRACVKPTTGTIQ